MKRWIFLFSVIPIALLFFQNCTRYSFRSLNEAPLFESLSSSSSGNGGVYDGKPIQYYHFVPGFSCEGKESYRHMIEISGKKIRIWENEPQECAKKSHDLQPEEIGISTVQKDVISWKDYIFVRLPEVPVQVPRQLSKVLCRDDFSRPQLELLLQSNDVTNQNSLRFYSASENIEDLASTQVNMTSNLLSASAFGGELRLEVQTGVLASGSANEYVGLVKSSSPAWISRIGASRTMRCILGASLERSLAFKGSSSWGVPVTQRFVDQNLTPIWNLTGTCNPARGSVRVEGDLDLPVTVPCNSNNGGEFSLGINYDGASPKFNVLKGPARRLMALQGSGYGADSATTWLYKIDPLETPTLVTTASELQNMQANSTQVHYILGGDIDLSLGGSLQKNNWNPGRWFEGAGPGFEGTLSGDGHTIANLDVTSGYWSACLFESTYGTIIRNLKLSRINVRVQFWSAASTHVGSIACIDALSWFDRIQVDGVMTAEDSKAQVGGLIGASNRSRVTDSQVDVTITGTSAVAAGGLVGGCADCTVISSVAHGSINISSNRFAGGLIGSMLTQTLTASISDSFADVSVAGALSNGGVVGELGSANIVFQNVAAIGDVTGNLAGPGSGRVVGGPPTFSPVSTGVYFLSSSVCSSCSVNAGQPLTPAEFQDATVFVGWDFSRVWMMPPGAKAPSLQH